MHVVNNTVGRVLDYSYYDGVLTLYGNKRLDYTALTALKDSKTLLPGITRTAKTVKVVPKESDFIYIRNRAISAGNVVDHGDNTYELIPHEVVAADWPKYAFVVRGANSNGDYFSHEELLKSYKTFIGKSVFVDHQADSVDNARGIVLDAVYNENGYYVELLEAIDQVAFPQLANSIVKRYVTGTSMGCSCQYAVCSVCGHKSYTIDDVCEHVEQYKGFTWQGVPVVEYNCGVCFDEDSIVTNPADVEALILERVAHVHGRQARRPRTVMNPVGGNLKAEVNQRTRAGRVKSLTERLTELPWS